MKKIKAIITLTAIMTLTCTLIVSAKTSDRCKGPIYCPSRFDKCCCNTPDNDCGCLLRDKIEKNNCNYRMSP